MARHFVYFCRGPVRGRCSHRHFTLESAIDCCNRDHRACKRQHGYSDRRPQRIDGAPMGYDEDVLLSSCGY